MLVNTYKNERMLSLNTSAQYRHCVQCYCYTLTAMPTRQAGNQPTHKKTTHKYERFISTDDTTITNIASKYAADALLGDILITLRKSLFNQFYRIASTIH